VSAANPALPERVHALEVTFAHIARTRMADVPLLHPELHVQAVGFAERCDGTALGVLITPWFMNLVRLPLVRDERAALHAHRTHQLGAYSLEFTSAFEAELGAFECCSLFSPVHEFADQAAAVATACEILRELAPRTSSPPALGRRALFFGARRPSARRAR